MLKDDELASREKPGATGAALIKMLKLAVTVKGVLSESAT